ncbi:MAG: sodium-independent anion transporter, partial [Comamonas sp.]
VFFGNADAVFVRLLAQVDDQIRLKTGLKAVVLSLEESPDLDSTALEALTEFAAQIDKRGLQLRLARVKDSVRELLGRVQIPTLAADSYVAWSVDDAVAALRSRSQDS